MPVFQKTSFYVKTDNNKKYMYLGLVYLDNLIIYKGWYVMHINKIEDIYQPKLSNTYSTIKQKNLQNYIDKCWRKEKQR